MKVKAKGEEVKGEKVRGARRLRCGFTLIEVLMAAAILVLFPAGALVTTLRLEQFARTQSEEMAAAAFCEDVYNRCLREEAFTNVTWKSYSNSGIELTYVQLSGDDTKIYPLKRTGYSTPQYRIQKSGDHDVRVSLRWGLKRKQSNGKTDYDNYYHR